MREKYLYITQVCVSYLYVILHIYYPIQIYHVCICVCLSDVDGEQE